MDLASLEAAQVPYWAATPASVLGHREAARALELAAEVLLDEAGHTGAANGTGHGSGHGSEAA